MIAQYARFRQGKLGKQGTIELGLFLGNYASLALMVSSFDVDLPPDRKEPLMPV